MISGWFLGAKFGMYALPLVFKSKYGRNLSYVIYFTKAQLC